MMCFFTPCPNCDSINYPSRTVQIRDKLVMFSVMVIFFYYSMKDCGFDGGDCPVLCGAGYVMFSITA
jgi:hypothetical protein